MQAAGAGQGVEDASELRSGMAAEEHGVLSGQRDVTVDTFDLIIVPGVVAGRGDGLDAVPFVQEVVHCAAHLRFGRVLVCLRLDP